MQCPPKAAEISGTVLYDDGATVLGGATVQLVDVNGNPLADDVVSGDDGGYMFKSAPEGTNIINVIFNGDIVGGTQIIVVGGQNVSGLNITTNRLKSIKKVCLIF